MARTRTRAAAVPKLEPMKPQPIEPDAIQPAAPAIEPAVEPVPASDPVAATPTLAAQVRTAPSPEKDVIMDINTAAEKTQAFFSGFTDRSKGAVEKSTQMFEEMNAFGKGNVEAIVESSKIAAKAFETVGQDVADYAKTSFESSAAAFRTLASATSPTEFFKLQSDYARAAFDTMIAQSSRSTEKMLKLAGEIAQPISNRVAIATDKVKTAA
ncbi:phasin family protein [Sphingomonas ginsenosidivorax]|uniref:Phasin family protein n=2 Tax=Sphingomonas ginsenosidivorax TaxID=862135 RepID=A0A5C6UIN0_9SPHN|nr:phasin family protein [Sphingomonas ginsenosidivorax]